MENETTNVSDVGPESYSVSDTIGDSDNQFKDMIIQGIQTASGPVQSSYTNDHINRIGYVHCYDQKPVELELTDGRKTVVKLSFETIREMYEIDDGDGNKHVDIEFGVPFLEKRKLSVNCGLSALMRILGVNYTRWSENILSDTLENG